MRMPDKKKVSIIICTYNRAELLRECLESLCKQTSDVSGIDVIVVDNNSTDHTAEVVRELTKRLPKLRYVKETRQGLSHARNSGFREAVTPWVAYLDDDARTFPDYVENMQLAIKRNEFDCIGGIYLPWYKYGRPKWYKDCYGTNAGKPAGLLKENFASGGNLVIKKDVLKRFGGFSSKIGMSGKEIGYGEETRLQIMIRREGFTIGFDPKIRIEHLVPTYKQTPAWFMRASFAVGKHYWDSFLIERTFVRISKIFISSLIQTIKCGSLGLFKFISKKDYYIQNWMIDSFRPLSFAFGAAVDFFKEWGKN